VKPELKTVFEFLQDVGVTGYWRETIRSRVLERIGEIEPLLPGFNVIREIESLLGKLRPGEVQRIHSAFYASESEGN
jgi:hypothetical protein